MVTTSTDIDDAFVVADEQVAEDAGFVEVAQADHVLHSVDGGRVHGLDVGGILRRNPVFLCESGEKSEEIKWTVVRKILVYYKLGCFAHNFCWLW